MAAKRVLVDAGPLVAMLHRSDQFHAACIAEAKVLPRPFYTSWLVLAEAAWLVRGLPSGRDQLLAFVEHGLVAPLELDADATAWMRRFGTKYEDLAPQLADLSLCYLAEREDIDTLFTVDRRDFLVYRLTSGRTLNIVPASVALP